MRIKPLHLIPLFLLMIPSAVSASVDVNPMRLLLTGNVPAANSEQRGSWAGHIETAQMMELYEFALQGEGWTVHRLEIAAEAHTMPGDRIPFRFEATPTDPSRPLVMTWMADGISARREILLSAEHLDRLRGPIRGEQIPGTAQSQRTRAPRSNLAPAPRDPKEIDAEDIMRAHQAEQLASQGTDHAPVGKALSFTLSGGFVYDDPSGNERPTHGMTVNAYDSNYPLPSIFLGSDTTDENGNWSISVNWSNLVDPEPDVYLEFVAQNNRVTVRPDGIVPFVGPYTIVTYASPNVNDDRDWGDWRASDEDDHPAYHILGSGTKAWEYIDSKTAHDPPPITYVFPSPNWPSYSNIFQEIYIPRDYEVSSSDIRPFQWKEDTQIHEYGHHFIRNFGAWSSPDYCNGLCDAVPMGWIWELDCGHCAWCEENPSDAWLEGWPNWFADVVTRNFTAEWGYASLTTRDYEVVGNQCFDSDGSACACDPWETEGFLSSLLRDIEDSTGDDENPADPFGVSDVLSLGIDEIFTVTATDDPSSPAGFVAKFKARYPQHNELLWITAKNVGYELDNSNPAGVSGISSTSHPTGGSTQDTTPTFSWNTPSDDMSGILGYSVLIDTISNSSAGTTRDIGDVTSWTGGPLAPGTYWFHIRPQDRALRWGNTTHYGPFTVAAPDPADLTLQTLPNWDYPVVPRPTTDGSQSAVAAPTSLSGDTYFNLAGRNTGETATSATFVSRFYVDDVYKYWVSWGSVGPGQGFYSINRGPVSIRGGRHVLAARADALDDVFESNETNNDWGKQWVWAATILSPGTPLALSAPPDRVGGWGSTTGTTWYNVDGYRMLAHAPFNVTVLRATNHAADYDCRLHPVSSGAENGFASNLGYSNRPAGSLDAVLTATANLKKIIGHDVGVLNQTTSTSNYVIEQVSSQSMAFESTEVLSFSSSDFLAMRHLDLQLGQLAPVTILLEGTPGDVFHAAYFGANFSTGDLMDYSAYAVMDASGYARVDLTPAGSGLHGVAVFRDPIDGNPVTSVALTVRGTPPDFAAYTPTGWHSPLVPRPANDGTSGSAPAPTTLSGDAASTYLNIAVRNDSPIAALSGLYSRVYLDGAYKWWLSYGNFGAGASSRYNWSSAWTVPGGRHALSILHDQDERYDEISELDNIHGEQWIWEPSTLALGSPLTRGTPPERTGGWSDITTGETLWYNADGLRLAQTSASGQNGYWKAMAVMPGGSADVDVRLHEVSSGAKSGFGSSLAYSGFGPGESDFVLVNHRNTAFRPFDVGTLRISGSGGYTAYATSSTYHLGGNNGPTPGSLPAGQIIRLHEFLLNTGSNVISLDNLTPEIDWGVSVYQSQDKYETKASGIIPEAQFDGGTGEGDSFSFDNPARGYYCVAVWKKGSADLSRPGAYELRISSGATAVEPSDIPLRSGLTSIHPNPFNPRTTITYSVREPAEVVLEIYNLRGERVRQVERIFRGPGVYPTTWTGLDDRGRQVASGAYLIRLRVGSVEDRRKITLVR